MPLYYFNFFNDIDTIAEEGVDLANIASARDEARRGAATMIAEHIMKGVRIDPTNRIEVADEHGQTVFVLHFRDLIRRD